MDNVAGASLGGGTLLMAGQLLEGLPAAIYTTDAAGRITYYNEAAARMWGQRPELGRSEFCGSWKLYRPDGTPLRHDECPMALALRSKRPVRGKEAIAERPDGSRVLFLPFPTPFFDAAGELLGAVNMLVDISERMAVDRAAQQLAAIVESSDDAILTKDLDGIITSWNAAAQRLFGYTAAEAIGRSVTLLIPSDRLSEETHILDRIRAGERVEPYETIRRTRDGRLIEISLTVSPVRDANGRIVGASKIARDITERRQAEHRQSLLLREMDHRVRNALALSKSIVSLSARSAGSVTELAQDIQGRLTALADAHALTLPKGYDGGEDNGDMAMLHALIATILSPYADRGRGDGGRVTVSGADIPVRGSAVTSLALLLHELATNAAKHGALSTPGGAIAIDCAEEDNRFVLSWIERGGPPANLAGEGFGSVLLQAMVAAQGGGLTRESRPDGLAITLSLDRRRLVERRGRRRLP